MKPATLERLREAYNFAVSQTGAGTKPQEIVDRMVADHQATFQDGNNTYLLRCAGVTATCTWSRDEGLLSAWTRLARRKINIERMA